jgi:carboxyl-terminal processing protease
MKRYLPFLLLLAACNKKDQPVPSIPTGPVTQKETNSWMLDSMRYFYLWNDQLPATVDTTLNATDYFARLKNKDDRFSFLYKPADQTTYPKYMLFVYGFDFSIIDGPTGITGVVKLIIPGSVAALKGMQRGSYFTQINGTTITADNAATLSNAVLQSGTTASFTMADGKVITLSAESLGENPIYQQTTATINGKVVAYLFYNYFNDTYNRSLVQTFQQFKDAGATELILDLRYNPGGSVAAAALINAMIAPNITEQSVFAEYSGNSHLGQRNISYKSALSVPESGTPVAFSALSPGRLSLNRVFILSGAKTASAAELTINSLKPYTTVIQIGEKTYGKDKGAVIITDKRIPWALLPITYNLLNSKSQGGYSQGITPDYIADEMATLPLLPIGDKGDPLIAKAISIISGNGRQANQTKVKQRYYDAEKAAADMNVIKIKSFTGVSSSQ